MGIYDTFRSLISSAEGEGGDDCVDHYVIRHMPWDSKGGFRRLDGWSDLEDPITRQEFEYNVADLDPGRYRLFGVDAEGNLVSLPDDESWVWEVGSPGEGFEDNEAQEVQQLEQTLDDLIELKQNLREELESSTDPMEEARASVLRKMVSSEDFMAQHGKRIFRDFVLESSSDWDDEDVDESASTSSIFADLALDLDQPPGDIPQEQREGIDTSSDEMDAYINSLAANARDRGNQARQEIESAKDDSRTQLSHIDGGSDSIDDLGMSETDVADEVARELNSL